MKKKQYYIVMIITTPLILCTILYLLLGAYYKNSYNFGTWVNNIYCTGKTVDVINAELCDRAHSRQVCIVHKDGEKEYLDLTAIAYTEDYKEPLQHLKEEQNPFLWGQNLFSKQSQILLPKVTYDKELLSKELSKLNCMQINTATSAPRVAIIESDQGYELFDNTSDILDQSKAIARITGAIEAGEKYINLDDGICYPQYPITQEWQNTYLMWNKVKEFQNYHMTYLFGECREELDSRILADWIQLTKEGDFALDDTGNLILNEVMIEEYIASLASKYDTVGGTRQFKTTRGDIVTIEGGTYGNQLDQEAEVAYLTKAYLTHNEADRIPTYRKTAWQQGTEDIGDTYVEIDMGEQMMYYYKQGIQQLKTPIVTGNVARKHATPERVCYVYAKQKNLILRGPGYASHVNYWMAVNGGIGIHDAKWRKEFGGNIYKTAGSHGCINTPYDAMSELYDMVEMGTPVVMFN
ncbi:MAG: L,D-transpeptidase family protein [Lachnospiraceae bacterium]